MIHDRKRRDQGCIKPLICVKPSKALQDFSGHCLRFDILSADAETGSIAKQSRTGRPGATPDQPRFLPTATALEYTGPPTSLPQEFLSRRRTIALSRH